MERAPGIRPRPSLWRRLDAGGRVAFPFVSSALFLLVLAAPLGLPGQSALRPALALACVFFWSVYRPGSMSPLAAFGLGLLADLLGAAPIGIFVLGLLAAQSLALRWRWSLIRRDFFVTWLAFGVAALVFAAIVWLLNCVFTAALLPPQPVLFQAALAAGCYPVLALSLLLAHRGAADPAQA